MAQQLRRQGCTVGFLGLLDSSLPTSRSPVNKLRSANLAKLEPRLLVAHLARAALGNLQALVRGCARLGCDLPKLVRCKVANALGRRLPLDLEDFYYFHEITQPSRHAYVPQAYPHRAVLFRASDEDPYPAASADLGWSRFLPETLIIEPMPARHGTMLQEPVVRCLAEKLRNHLDRTPADP